MTQRLKVNVRFGSLHVQSSTFFPWLGISANSGHQVGGEFRTVRCHGPSLPGRTAPYLQNPDWRPFAIYRLFGLEGVAA
jgi:hypothetical protein